MMVPEVIPPGSRRAACSERILERPERSEIVMSPLPENLDPHPRIVRTGHDSSGVQGLQRVFFKYF